MRIEEVDPITNRCSGNEPALIRWTELLGGIGGWIRQKKKKETEGIRVYEEETEVTVLSYMYVMR